LSDFGVERKQGTRENIDLREGLVGLIPIRDFQKLNYPNLSTQHDCYSLCSPGNSIFF
jgi:hypothetical protein